MRGGYYWDEAFSPLIMNLATTQVTELSKAMVLTEFGYQRNMEKITVILNCLKGLLAKGIHSVRIMGSGVLDLCYIACGRLDCVYAGVAGNHKYLLSL
jgi:fructose-1,6-bisphosphatase/inositol monophosphatase family enzyme